MRITYIGHATLLIELGGRIFLTDPNFDASLGRLLPRVSAPGILLHELPRVDAVFVTHAHADHLSFDSLDGLPRDIPIYAPPAIARWLKRRGYGCAKGLAPGEVVENGPVGIRATAATHKGHRYGIDRWRGDANMYLFDTNSLSCLFAGDTALTPESTHIVELQLAPESRRLDIALLPIGHAPWWKPGFRKGHLTSTDALTFFERLNARYLIPYHWGTFDHVTSKAHDAIDRLRTQLPAHSRGADVRILEPGAVFELPVEEKEM
ncbi:MAG: MBL fold metallo-hydrolase [Gemmatimonadaceae bacterium]|nr:MBL fold metallo-hydrolase [Gemmatimonadaceae bacterium]